MRRYLSELARQCPEFAMQIADHILSAAEGGEYIKCELEKGVLAEGEDGILTIVTSDEDGGWNRLVVARVESADDLGDECGWYSGPGRGFASPATSEEKNGWLLINQSGGLDV